MSSKVECSVCHKEFTSVGNRNRHQREKHEQVSDSTGLGFDETLFKCFEGCELSFKSGKDLEQHLTLKHDFRFLMDELDFATFEDFEIWLQNLEKSENVRFYKPSGSKRNTSGSLEKFVLLCSRSGKTRLVSQELRKRRRQGSCKYNFNCTSHMDVTKDLLSRKCTVKYISTHYGHGEEMQHLRISKKSRKKNAQKLLLDDKITDNLNRDDILTKKDKTSVNININDGCRHKDDATSVSLWVKECTNSKSNPIRFFKPQGDLASECDLNINDLVLVFMNQTQIEMLIKFGNRVVCVDGTHGLCAHNFELTTLLVLDEFDEGFPVAFLFSNRQDTYVYEIFFSCIKKAIGTEHEITCNVFISDLDDSHYNAWTVIMGAPEKKLYCSWHVDRAWQQNLSKVLDLEKRKWVYDCLKNLQTSLQIETFEKEFEEFLSILENDDGLIDMYCYLMNYYFNNRLCWAYCYSGITMPLENMHRVVKHIYLEAKRIKRMDKTINALQKYLRNKVLGRLIKQKGKCHLNDIQDRHRAALVMSYRILSSNNNIFEICDDEQKVTYFVKKLTSNICCPLACTLCNICVHSYECTCLDYLTSAVICKHIHLVNVQNINSNNIICGNSEDENESGMINELSMSISEMSSQDWRNRIVSELSQLQNNITTLNYTEEEFEHIFEHIKSFKNWGSASLSESTAPFPSKSANEKIEKQIAFFSTKKKQHTKSDSKENKTIVETLYQSSIISNDPSNDHAYS